VPLAVEPLGHLWAAQGTAADAQERRPVSLWASQGQEVTGDAVARACGAQGSPGAPAAEDAHVHYLQLDVVKLPEAKKGLVLVPQRWGVERSKAWAARFRRLARDDDR
jgi:transposase